MTASRSGRVVSSLTGVLGLAAILSGTGLAVHAALADGPGPAGVVEQYFAAVRDGDALTALRFGTVPAGDRSLLSTASLRAQQRAAPLRDLDVRRAVVDGVRAHVGVDYRLGGTSVATRVGLHRRDGSWRMDEVAIPTRLVLDAASDRARIAGVRPFAGTALVFPGALPVRFDTNHFAGSVATGTVTFGAPATTGIDVRLTGAGSAAAQQAVRAALTACLRDGGVSCPQPGERYVPGSLRGRLTGSLEHAHISLTAAPAGVIRVDADVEARTTYRRLDFYNRASNGSGTVRLDVHALVGGSSSESVRWTS